MPRVLAIVLAWLLFALLFAASGRPASAQPPPAPPAAPAASAIGRIAGTVIDKSTGDTIIDAGVEIVELKKTVRTDIDGKFNVKVAPGTYTIRFFAPLYQGARVTNVVVVANQVATADAALAPEGEEKMQVVEVVAAANKAAEETQLVKRKNAAVVSDTISAEQFKKAPDSDAAEVVERVPSVTINDEDDTVVVRGLGDRYSQALLNRSRLPSTDPNKRVVSLDLFPSAFLDSINIVKSYTPDLPGDFAGGLVDLELRDYPDQLTYSLGFSMSGNTQTTFQDYDTYEGSKWDYFGFGNSFRELPDIFPDTILQPRVPESTARQRAIAGSLNNIWDVETKTAPPNWGANFSIGNRFDWWGFNFAALYDNKYQYRPNEIRNTFYNRNTAEDPDIAARDLFTYEHSTFTARMGGILTMGFDLDPKNKINVRALVNHQGNDDVKVGTGTNESEGAQVQLTQDAFTWTEENLGFGQLSGQHLLPEDYLPAGTEVEWRTALSQTTQEIPDQRFVLRSSPDGAPPAIISKQPSLLRVFSSLDEWMSDSSVDVTVPFATGLPGTDVWSGLAAKLKFGGAYAYRSRDFNLRRFNYDFPDGSLYDFTQSPEVLLRTQNLGVGNNYFQFQELTQAVDFFTANQEIAGLYGMVELPIIQDQLKFVGGLRGEYSYIHLETSDRQSMPLTVNLKDLNPIPGVNLIYTPMQDMNVRFSYSLNVSRPEFRELTPVQYVEPSGIRTLVGNPFLVSATIANYDLRWEWFPSANDVVSFGFFYKSLDQPIEKVALSFSTIDVDSFKNATDATLWGFEVEFRRNLAALVPYLPENDWRGPLSSQLPFWNFFFNVAYTDSEVNVGRQFTPEQCAQIPDPKPPDCTQVVTNNSRQLQGQAPYVVNAGIEYDNDEIVTGRLLYNIIGPRINAAGLNGLPDIFDEPRNQLDFVALKEIPVFGVPLDFKFSIENLLNDRYLQTQADADTIRYRDGLTFGFGVSYSY